MKTITKCLNEWNATLEALGQGKQTILIRKYDTTLEHFLLYPTVTYARSDDFLDSFKEEERDFVKENAIPKRYENRMEVKYFAKVENIIEKSSSRMGTVNKFHIWTPKHVKSYIGSGKAYIWVLRIYQLKNSVMVDRSKGLIYANVTEDVSLEGINPVLSDSEFNEIINNLK